MNSGLKPYPEYRDSGLPWLPSFPLHWTISRIKTVLRELDRRSPDGVETLLSLTRLRGLIPQAEASNRIHGAKTLVGYKLYHPGQIVMNRMQAWSGMFGACDLPGLVSPDYAVFQIVGDHNVEFLSYRLKSPDMVGQFALESKGIGSGFNRLYTDRFGSIPITLPPPDEQAAIVRFLNHANQQLGSAIRAKKKLIALLNEQKQAIIHRAVTRGLDPNVRLKPSGVPWLGDIPEHWEPLQVRRLVSLVTSGSRGWARYYSDEGAIFLQSGNLGRSMALNLSFVQHVRLPEGSEGMRTRVVKDDLLLCITGALTGNTVAVDIDLASAYVNQHVALLRPKREEVFPRFLAYVLHSPVGQAQFKTSEYGGTKQGLGLSDVKSVFIALPPLRQQKAIAAHLDASLKSLADPITRAQREIDLIREYRTRLIADVVTGQLDVREAARDLPAEVEEPEAAIEQDSEDEPEDLLEAVDE